MLLTREEKKAIVIPVVLALLILAVLALNSYFSKRQRMLEEMTAVADQKISAHQEHLFALQDLAQSERFYRQYRLDEWIPVFSSILEVRLFLSQKATRCLSAVGAVNEDWSFEAPQTRATPHIGEFQIQALFPSYTALVHFLSDMEETPPPVLSQEVEIVKTGITLDTSIIFHFGYRLNDETV